MVPVRQRDSSSYSFLMVLLLTGLSLLAWISTYSGMLQLIAASSGEIGTAAMIALGFAVLMLQGMIIYILNSLFSGQLRTPALSAVHRRLYRPGLDLGCIRLRFLLAVS